MHTIPPSPRRPRIGLSTILLGALALAGCNAPGQPVASLSTPSPTPPSTGGAEPAPSGRPGSGHRGEASFYHDKFEGRTMANGETFDQQSDSAASKTLPLGSKAEVRNLENGRTAVVTIEDRGPFVSGRVIDVSKKTAERLDMVDDGTAPVEVRPLKGGGRN